MPSIPCPIKSLCVDPAAPITNFSSEAPDRDDFFSYASRNQGAPPVPGENWAPDAIFGPGTCVSPISQAEADLCAGRLAPTDPGTHRQGTCFPDILQGRTRFTTAGRKAVPPLARTGARSPLPLRLEPSPIRAKSLPTEPPIATPVTKQGYSAYASARSLATCASSSPSARALTSPAPTPSAV
jgi:hypothetical protein